MSSSEAIKREKSSSLTVLLLMLAVPVLVVLGIVYLVTVYQPEKEGTAIADQTVERMIGLSTPIVGGNRLAAGFTDADNDLVADAPTDPALWIDPPTLTFSYIAQEEPEKIRDAWKPFVDHLSKITGRPVEYKLYTDSMDQLKAIRSGELHVAGLNSGSVPIAVDAAGYVPVGLVPGTSGEALTSTKFIVPAGGAIKRLEDIRGREMTYTTPLSNSGFKAPILTLLEKAKLRPGTDYKIRYSHGHGQSILGIARQEYEVAAVASDMIDRAIAAGEVKKDSDFRVVYESESFPTGSLGYVHTLKPELATKVREALLTFDWKGTSLEKELAASKKTTLVPANYKNDFSLLRKIDDVTGTAHVLP